MKYLVFDTETTGLFTADPKEYRDIEQFPRIVEIAWVLFEDDREISSGEYIIRPDGFEIPERASNLHGIATEKALTIGIDREIVFDRFLADFKACDKIVAHNIKYDKTVVASELCRMRRSTIAQEFFTKRYECTMMSTIKLCQLPKTNGHKGFKWPKLQELHNFLFESQFDDAHSALADVRATYRCFRDLIKRGVILEKAPHKEEILG
jgi:DNA polymerase III epsilon subunit-like protein